MKVYSEKTFLFENGDEKVVVRNKEIKDVPEWVTKTTLFKLAEKDGSIQVLGDNKQQKAAENGELKKSKGKKIEEVKENNESPTTDKE